MASKIGDLCETQGEITFEWRIKDFSSLSKEINARYDSPTFYFTGASWDISLYPNGQTNNKTEGWLSLYLLRRLTGSSVTLNFSLIIKKVDGKNYYQVTDTAVFAEKNKGRGNGKVILRSDLMEKKSELLPSGTLTVVCSVKNSERNCTAGSLFSRFEEISDNLREIYFKAKKADFLLKTDGHDFPAHRLILETRSPVFAAMLSHDTKEKQTGEVSVEDVDFETMFKK